MQDIISLKKKFNIDKSSKLPYYYQLKQYIIEEIEKGNWKPGQQILPEIKICEIFDISRTVVRQTYQELVNEGYLIKKKAKGTFIAAPKISENLVQSLMGFYEDMTARGFKVRNDIIWQKRIPATLRVAEKLGLKIGEDVIVIRRVRRLNDEPTVLDRTYIPYKLCPDLLNEDLINRSLYSFIEGKYNLKLARGIRFIEATVASEEESKSLNIKKGAPLIYIESVNYLDNGTPLEYYIALHRGDRSRLVTELRRMKSYGEIGVVPTDSMISGIMMKEKTKK